MKQIIKNSILLTIFIVFSSPVLGDSIERLKARLDQAWCGNDAMNIWHEARNGENWNTLSQLTKTQVLKLEEISLSIYKFRRDSEIPKKDAGTKLTFRQELKLKQFAGLIYDAIYVRLFRTSIDLPKFTESQIIEINQLLLNEPIDIDKMKRLAFI
jgi:hypothetical protein